MPCSIKMQINLLVNHVIVINCEPDSLKRQKGPSFKVRSHQEQ